MIPAARYLVSYSDPGGSSLSQSLTDKPLCYQSNVSGKSTTGPQFVSQTPAEADQHRYILWQELWGTAPSTVIVALAKCSIDSTQISGNMEIETKGPKLPVQQLTVLGEDPSCFV